MQQTVPFIKDCKLPIRKVMKRHVFLIVLFSLCTCVREPKIIGSYPAQEKKLSLEEQSQHYLALAYDHYKEGNFIQAVQLLENAKLLNATLNYHHLLLLGQCLLKIGRYSAAHIIGQEIIEQYPHTASGYEVLAFSALAQGEFEKAENNYVEALDLNDHDPLSYFYLGMIYDAQEKISERDKNFTEAEAELLSILRNNPSDFGSRFELSYLYVYWNRNLNEAQDYMKKLKNAVALMDMPEEKQKWNDFYLLALEGMLLTQRQQYKDAISKMTLALASVPAGVQMDLAEVYLYLGKSFEGLHEDKRAEEFYNKALQTDPLTPYLRRVASLKSLKK